VIVAVLEFSVVVVSLYLSDLAAAGAVLLSGALNLGAAAVPLVNLGALL
jgi:hypothetical protein